MLVADGRRDIVKPLCSDVFALQTDCVNYVKMVHHYNRTHLYTCGTGAFHPTCAFVEVGQKMEARDTHTHTPPAHLPSYYSLALFVSSTQ